MLLNSFWLHYHTLSSRVRVPVWIPVSYSDSSSRFSLCSRWYHHVMLTGCHMTHISILRSDWWSGRGGGQGLKLLPKFLHPHLSRWQTCTSSPSFILCSAVNGQVAMGQCLAPSSIRRWGEEVMWPGLLHLLVWFSLLSEEERRSCDLVCSTCWWGFFLFQLLRNFPLLSFVTFWLGNWLSSKSSILVTTPSAVKLSFLETAGGELECLARSLVWTLPLECSNFFFFFGLQV